MRMILALALLLLAPHARAASGSVSQSAQPVTVTTLPLPTGAATESTLGSVKTQTDKLTFTGTRLLVDIPAGGSGLTDSELRATPVPVSGSFAVSGSSVVCYAPNGNTTAIPTSLASVPSHAVTNAGTFAVQVNGSTIAVTGLASAALATESSLSSLNGKVTAVNTGAVVLAGGTANVGTVNGSTIAITGLASAALATETTLGNIKTGTDRIPAQGQALAGASLPVVLTAAQIVTLTPPAAITNFANETGGNLATIVTNTNKIPTSPATDRATAASPASCRLSDGSAFYAGATETTLSTLNGKVTACNTGAVTVSAALPAGSALLGKTGIDQTTDGTTNRVNATIAAAQTLATVTTVGAVTAITNALPAGTNRLGSARVVDSADADQTSVKGTQTSRFLGTQDAKDAGRTVFIATASATGVITEAMVSMSPARGFVGGVAATSMGVTSGKTLRIQSWCCTWRNATAVAGGVTCTLRAMSTGSTTVTSPWVSVLNASTALATIGSGATACESFPDGIELSGNNTFGVSIAAVGTVNGSSVTVKGYEY